MLVSEVGGESYTPLVIALTDAAGRATVRIQLSRTTGDAWIAVTVPLLGVADSCDRP
jgi:hypothetical protein